MGPDPHARPCTPLLVLLVALVALAPLSACSAAAGQPGRGGRARPTASPAGTPAAGASTWVGREETRAGTTSWRLTDPAKNHAIEGYADHASVAPGTPVRLFVSTAAPRFTAAAYRMGWYGGSGARRVWVSAPTAGQRQPPARLLADTRTETTVWRPSITMPTAGWVPGDYLIKLTALGLGARSPQSYVPLTVRTATARGRVVVLNAVTTWQAYNDYGGRDLYHGPGDDPSTRSYAVSFDRPYATGHGAGQFLVDEVPVVRLTERLGLDLAYLTSTDLQRDPTALRGARAVLSLGHDEYWSLRMRQVVTAARDAGTNLAFLGANAVFRHIRLASTPLGPDRLVVNYRDPALDPLRRTDPADVTSDWREPPDPRPESTLTGALYESNPVDASMVFVSTPAWLFHGSGLTPGAALPGLVGSEYDRARPGPFTPARLQVLAHSPVTCRGVRSYADVAYYSTSSGAGVIDTGTNSWVRALAGAVGGGRTARRTTEAVTAVTTNLLRAFAAGPAGRAHPAVDNLRSFETYPGDPIAARHNLW